MKAGLRYTLWGAGSLLALIGLCGSPYLTNEKEQAVLTQTGKPVMVIAGSFTAGEIDTARVDMLKERYGEDVDVRSGAGLRFKMPILQSVKHFDDRILEYDSAPAETQTKEKKTIKIDSYARWSIEDPLRFMTNVGSVNNAYSRLDDVIYSAVRQKVGENNLIEIVRNSNEEIQTTEQKEFEVIERGREAILKEVTELADEKADEYGIRIHDVRIKRAELPEENKKYVFDRMRAERKRIATKYTSEGQEMKTKIQAETDKEAVIIRADAYEQAEIIKGEGDAQAIKIYAEAYSQAPDFFEMLNTLEGYKKSLDENTHVVLPMDTDYLKYFKGADGR